MLWPRSPVRKQILVYLARALRASSPIALVGALVACGGSASETPPPLPPHAHHEPYRVPPVRPARPAPDPEPAEPEKEAEVDENAPAPSTWGTEPAGSRR